MGLTEWLRREGQFAGILLQDAVGVGVSHCHGAAHLCGVLGEIIRESL